MQKKRSTGCLIINVDAAMFCDNCKSAFHPGCFDTELRANNKNTGLPKLNKCCSFFAQSAVEISSTYQKIMDVSKSIDELLLIKTTLGNLDGRTVSIKVDEIRKQIENQHADSIIEAINEQARRKVRKKHNCFQRLT